MVRHAASEEETENSCSEHETKYPYPKDPAPKEETEGTASEEETQDLYSEEVQQLLRAKLSVYPRLEYVETRSSKVTFVYYPQTGEVRDQSPDAEYFAGRQWFGKDVGGRAGADRFR